MKLKNEREEQRKIREQIREDAAVIKENEEREKKIEKEDRIAKQGLADTIAHRDAAPVSEREQYEPQIQEWQETLKKIERDKADLAYRKQSTRMGRVYIISNIGCFGEGVFKIGVTRREDPQDRIDELGDSSVPFNFDVHAVIFSDDAPALEGALHEQFADRSVNKINPRKEFFRVSLEEIEAVVRTHHNKLVEFKKIAPAEDYRLTLAKEKAMAQTAGVSSN